MNSWGAINSKYASILAVMTLMAIVLTTSAYSIAEAQQATPQVRQITLIETRFGFNGTKGGPDIIVNQGDTVRIRLISNDTINHDWVLDAKSPSPYDVKSLRIRSVGNTTTVEFVATFPGTFKYYCSVAPSSGLGHRQRGMEGNLIVNAADLSGQVMALDAQVKSLNASVDELKGSISSQTSILIALSALALVLSIAATVISFSVRRKTARPS